MDSVKRYFSELEKNNGKKYKKDLNIYISIERYFDFIMEELSPYMNTY